jgi:hypothetical protein
MDRLIIERGEGLAKKAWLLIRQEGVCFLVRSHICDTCAKVSFAEPHEGETGKIVQVRDELINALIGAKEGGELEKHLLQELSTLLGKNISSP